MTNPSQLFLLADHIKLSLLERQRAISLDLEPNTQDGEISRSLESLRDGLEGLENDSNLDADAQDQVTNLRNQYDDLASQFYGEDRPTDTTRVPSDGIGGTGNGGVGDIYGTVPLSNSLMPLRFRVPRVVGRTWRTKNNQCPSLAPCTNEVIDGEQGV